MTEHDLSGTRGLAPSSVLEVAGSVLSDLDVEVVLDRVVNAARELTGARYAAIGVLNASRTGLARFITVGIDEDTRRHIGPLPTGHGVLGELIRDPVPLRLAKVGNHPRSYGFPAGHPPMQSFLGVPVMVAGAPFGNLYLTDKPDGDLFTEADEKAVVLLSEFAGVAIDHAQRYSGSEARRGELERTVAALDATIQISRALGGQTDLATVLELVAKRGRDLVSARTLVIELEHDEEMEVAAAAGESPDGLVGQRLALKDSVAGAALRTRRPQRLEDDLTRVRFEEHGLGRLGFDVEAGLVVPLLFSGRSFGVLIALDRLVAGPEFTAEDEALLEAFATSAATAVATAQSAATERLGERLAAAEQERGRWARELHDETLQGLAAVRIGLSSARRRGDRVALDEAVDAAIDQLEGEVTGLRALITDLRPLALDQLGAKAAIEALPARASNRELDIKVHVDLAYEEGREAERPTPELETALYRIVQEALTNASKHGGAHHAAVEVIEGARNVEVTVRDDGAGFDPADSSEGFGVLGMRERAELLLGRLDIESAPGQGTTLRATLPVRRRAAPPPPAAVTALRGTV